ncbi:MAG: site-specific integrase [Gemmatales bacterium]
MSEQSHKPNRDSERIGELVSIFQRGRKWYANYQLDGRQQRDSMKTTNKKEARARAMKIEVQLNEGTFQAKQTVKSIAEGQKLYLDQLRVNGRARKTLGKYQLVMDRVANLANLQKCTKLSQVNLLFVDQYRIARSKAKKPPGEQTIHDEVMIIRTWINFCLKRKLIAEDPLEGLSNPEPVAAIQPCWTWEQVNMIIDASPENIKSELTFLAHTGARFGELAWLKWEDLDLEKEIIHIRAKEGWKPKSGDQRVITMSNKLRDMFTSMPRISAWVMTMPVTQQQRIEGKQWSEKRLLGRLKKVLKQLGLPGHLHTFRHSFISYALSGKTASETTVRSWVGHVDEEILRHYAKTHDHVAKAAMDSLMNQPILRPQQGGVENKSA